jgi:hypothetical protein
MGYCEISLGSYTLTMCDITEEKHLCLSGIRILNPKVARQSLYQTELKGISLQALACSRVHTTPVVTALQTISKRVWSINRTDAKLDERAYCVKKTSLSHLSRSRSVEKNNDNKYLAKTGTLL